MHTPLIQPTNGAQLELSPDGVGEQHIDQPSYRRHQHGCPHADTNRLATIRRLVLLLVRLLLHSCHLVRLQDSSMLRVAIQANRPCASHHTSERPLTKQNCAPGAPYNAASIASSWQFVTTQLDITQSTHTQVTPTEMLPRVTGCIALPT